MVIACPRCSLELELPECLAGRPDKTIRCTGCRTTFRLREAFREPAPEPEPPPPPAPPRIPPVARPPALPPVRISSPPPVQIPPPGPDLSFHLAQVREGALPETLEAEREAPGDRWEVDRADYAGTTFDLDELQDLVKRGWLDRTDGIRRPGALMWTSASDHPRLALAFALRQKLDAQKLKGAESRRQLYCTNHARRKAVYRCDGCARVFCDHCGNETEIRQQPVVLCVECDEPMVLITRAV